LPGEPGAATADPVASSIAGVDPMGWLRGRLGLTAAEEDALWLLACAEIDPGVARLAGVLAMTDAPELSIQLWQGLARVAGGDLPAASIERLVALGLVEASFDVRLTAARRWVRANDRVVQLARGEVDLDREVAEIAALVDDSVTRRCTPPHELVRAATSTPHPLVVVHGGDDGAGRDLLSALASASGARVLEVRADRLAGTGPELRRQLRAIVRECCLFEAVPVFVDADALVEQHVAALDEQVLGRFRAPVFAATRMEHRIAVERPVVTHRVVVPTAHEREALWRAALPTASDDAITAAAERYRIGSGTIAAAAANASARAATAAPLARDIHAGIQTLLDRRLAAVATRVESGQCWDDVVLPRDQLYQLGELAARIRHRARVLETWGFGAKVGKGGGVAALFSGPPGTGKTMAAGLVARELGLDLYQIDLSKIVSKYIGETEKQLAAVFDAAEAGHAILLFDEADSLFAKRTDVKSSNDRYANLEVNYLLQRIEAFTGVCILTTNHESAIDEAFRRRLAIHVRFPLPDEAERADLWKVMFPPGAPVAGSIDSGSLARDFVMSGGYIKNALVRAAYLAADADEAIAMHHLVRGARAEYEAMGKVAYEVQR
jgi:hypothetical protein